MGKYSIVGNNRLTGEINVQGSKNAVLPILAATILNRGISRIINCPKISDVTNMINILKSIGCKVEWHEDYLTVDATTLTTDEIPEIYVETMRSSIIVLGAMLGRLGSVTISYPGGCSIGSRPINMHLDSLKRMNVRIKEFCGFLRCETIGIVGSNIRLEYPSVGATENIMLAAVLSKGNTKIENAAKEPEIIELERFLNAAGAKISGAGTGSITIEGVTRLHEVTYNVMADRIVAGTYMMAAAVTKGDLLLRSVSRENVASICDHMEQMGIMVTEDDNGLRIRGKERLKSVDFMCTEPYPGFPTDMQAPMMIGLCLAKGVSVLSERIFESRFKHVPELTKMGADIELKGHLAIISGVDSFHSSVVCAEDLRGGAALILAGLAARGKTIVNNAHFIQRGYENIDTTLRSVNAEIYYEP